MGEFVVLDAMGVLYRHGNVVRSVLIPYLREHGCDRDEAQIRAAYGRCTLGEIPTSELWATLGVAETAGDDEYCLRHELTAAVHQVLGGLREAGVRVLVLTNDAAPWSARLRERFAVGGEVERWFVSSEIGARKPDPAAYRPVLSYPGLEASRTVFVDDRPTNLVAAAAAGLRPLLFHSDDTAANLIDGFRPDSVRGMPELLEYLVEAG